MTLYGLNREINVSCPVLNDPMNQNQSRKKIIVSVVSAGDSSSFLTG